MQGNIQRPHSTCNLSFVRTDNLSPRLKAHVKCGEERKDYVGVMRKGVTGDWRNSFSPKVVEEFKRMTGNGLLELGFETDPDWGV